ncbi:hypothetical protein BOTBODRAFT_34705 [Botryobasidium botryosum FD-172 SS1]|uniref:TNFR-Cys domain-containing protein n=1 Tax=Botryobasidium botryosum (strain FD-172 SS1) TaxID=930990 RepID=A0A067MJM8_BOTB1|nr:hypothetical protein BOTBODRAFT_34705 [Botryobasidium botryosum FD-172 SS1]
MKVITISFLVLFVLSLPLFFGLFFGLNFPEIRRNGWPIAQCTVDDAQVLSRYCCEQTSCAVNTCFSAPPSAPQCSASITQINSNYSPAACAASNSTKSCPPNTGQACDGGTHCCRQCCQTCQSCHQSCTGSGSKKTCTNRCVPYQCNCICCSFTSHLECTLSCPTCYSVDLALTYTPWGSSTKQNATYHEEFSKNGNGANTFLSLHKKGSTMKCYYNPKSRGDVALDVSFTPWKWVITALFGMLPLAIASAYFFVAYALLPLWRRCTNSNDYQGVSSNLPQDDVDMSSASFYKSAEAKKDGSTSYLAEEFPAPPPPY